VKPQSPARRRSDLTPHDSLLVGQVQQQAREQQSRACPRPATKAGRSGPTYAEILAAVMDALNVPRTTPLDELPHLVALRCRTVSKTELDRLVRGAVKSAIDTHGPVDIKHLTSAAKRITGQIHAFLRAQHQGQEDPGQGMPKARRQRPSRPLWGAGPACRVCGCTEHHACAGGCYWVEPDLCSACTKAHHA
jgi:hypothetical protein